MRPPYARRLLANLERHGRIFGQKDVVIDKIEVARSHSGEGHGYFPAGRAEANDTDVFAAES